MVEAIGRQESASTALSESDRLTLLALMLRTLGGSFSFTTDEIESVNLAESTFELFTYQDPTRYVLVLKEPDDQGSV